MLVEYIAVHHISMTKSIQTNHTQVVQLEYTTASLALPLTLLLHLNPGDPLVSCEEDRVHG